MDVPSIKLAAVIVSGVSLGAVFAAVSVGLSALGEAGLQAIQQAGLRGAETAARVSKDLRAVQVRLLLGRALCVAFCVTYLGYTVLQASGPTAALIGVIVVVLGYAIAATMASAAVLRRSAVATLRLWKWLRPIELLLVPLAIPLNWIARLVAHVIPELKESDPVRLTELTVEHVIELGEEAGAFPEEQAELIRSVLEFKNTVAREIMVPRTQMIAFEIGASVDEVLERVIESGHSRYPVYQGHVDQVEGILYAKDLFRVLRDHPDLSTVELSTLVRKPVFFAAETQKIGMLLREMQRRRSHIAVVVDEFGGAAGIVTLEDIVEEIVGEIQDEHDEEAPLVSEHKPGHYSVDAGMSVYDLEERIGEEICQDKSHFDTLGGLIVHLAGRVPVVGESLQTGAYRIVILDADERRVSRVELRKMEPAPEPDEEEARAAAS